MGTGKKIQIRNCTADHLHHISAFGEPQEVAAFRDFRQTAEDSGA